MTEEGWGGGGWCGGVGGGGGGGGGVGESLSSEVRGSCKKYVEVASPFARILSAVVDPLVAL
jgi:hypothetical protein